MAIIELDFFKAEHAALLDLRAKMLDAMDTDSGPDAARITALRGRLGRIIVSHLTKEDRHLYPLLQQSDHVAMAAVAASFQAEMGDIAAAWSALTAQWPDERITAQPGAFSEAARPVLDRLADRIRREEQDLYPLCLATLKNEATGR